MRRIRGIVRAAGWIAAAAAALGGGVQEGGPPGFGFVKSVSVAAGTLWSDAQIDVKEGEEYYFRASGSVSLQKDNPVAGCGPEGLNLRTMRQPLTDRNLGALIGRILEKVEVVDHDSVVEHIGAKLVLSRVMLGEFFSAHSHNGLQPVHRTDLYGCKQGRI